MPKFEIKSWLSGKVLFSAELGSLKLTLEAGVKQGIDLSYADLDRARLDGARLVGARLDRASLVGASLVGASLVGASLDRASLVGASLDGARLDRARLDRASLVGASLDGARLDRASLVGASLVGASLVGASLVGASLDRARLDRASLVGASLVGASLDRARLDGARLEDFPEVVVPSLHRKILAAIEAGGELEMGSWHSCETTHCRGGWAIHLAGAPGRVLERCVGSDLAAAIIHLASCPQLEGKVPNFYATNEEALADIKRLADLEPEIEQTVSV